MLWSRGMARVIAAVGLGGLAFAGFAAPSAATAPPSTPIKHVVVLYLENHSFDNVLGYWCDQTGRCLGMPASVTLKDGAVVTPGVTPAIVPDIGHDVPQQTTAIDHGRMDGWGEIPGCMAPQYSCISGYEPSTIPNIITLASKFAISDGTFSMQDSPSWGGHLYAVMASEDRFIGGFPKPAPGVAPGPGWGCDSNKLTLWQTPTGGLEKIPSCVPDFSLGLPNGGAFEPTPARYAPTIMDRLQAAHLTWRIYSAKTGEPGYIWATCPSMAECLHTQQSHIRETGQFVTDAQAGKLPAFSLVLPGGPFVRDSEHNLFYMAKGDNWVGQIVSAVMNGPEWTSTALFITYDDCGCFYDQVPPGINPDGTAQGPRVPLVIISPYARPGYTDSTHTTFAGILAYIEQTFRLPSLSENDAGAYNFSNAFNYSQALLKPVRMVTRPLPASAKRIRITDSMLNDPT
jgi:phospholipase C